jgi:hypothetical protein
MARDHMPLPPSWRLNELFCLSDEYPTGLAWKIAKAGHKPGEQAGRRNKNTGLYVVSVDNKVYLAHRIVYYLQTEEDLTYRTVSHSKDNIEYDNRKPLIVSKLKIKPAPKGWEI